MIATVSIMMKEVVKPWRGGQRRSNQKVTDKQADKDVLPDFRVAEPHHRGYFRHFTSGGKAIVRFDVVNLFDEVYELRDGSGIGVGAPQCGQRRGFYGAVAYDF